MPPAYDSGSVDVVPPAHLAARVEQTQRLSRARPSDLELPARELPEAISAAFEAPIALASTGPTARDVRDAPPVGLPLRGSSASAILQRLR
ncbi:MAG: hypothetical protein ACRELB_17610 [Polyangiaceae bacterium]